MDLKEKLIQTTMDLKFSCLISIMPLEIMYIGAIPPPEQYLLKEVCRSHGNVAIYAMPELAIRDYTCRKPDIVFVEINCIQLNPDVISRMKNEETRLIRQRQPQFHLVGISNDAPEELYGADFYTRKWEVMGEVARMKT